MKLIWARRRTRQRGVQRGPAAQTTFRQALLGSQSQLRPTRYQATSLGSHSVLMRENNRSSDFEPHLGHGGAGLVDEERNSSKRSSHFLHRYS